ncbi:MAG: hypothetical protein ACREA8_01465 [Nitrosotalea sp.]
MTWRCDWKNCGHEEEYLIDLIENHIFPKHKDMPKETDFAVTELGQRTLL